MRRLLRALPLLAFVLTLGAPAFAQSGLVRAVLFYSPTCPHCHKVINEVLPPISATYNTSIAWSYLGEPPSDENDNLPALIGMQGDALQILYINTTTPLGTQLYQNAVERYQIPQERLGVPTLVIGETVLVGDLEIPEQLPGLIEEGLSAGGLDWPDIPDLAQAIAALKPMPQEGAEPAPSEPQPPAGEPSGGGENPTSAPALALESLTWRQRVLLDPIGNSISIVILIAMALSVVGVALRLGPSHELRGRSLGIAIPILAVVGMGIAAYLTFIEATGSQAVCGPVGDCNTVQQSPYAMLFGVLPVGALGLAGCLAMLATWLAARFSQKRIADLAAVALFAIAAFGTAFSIYLTFLEPFVIGATCAWCLTLAVIVTLLMWLSADRAARAYRRIRSAPAEAM